MLFAIQKRIMEDSMFPSQESYFAKKITFSNYKNASLIISISLDLQSKSFSSNFISSKSNLGIFSDLLI